MRKEDKNIVFRISVRSVIFFISVRIIKPKIKGSRNQLFIIPSSLRRLLFRRAEENKPNSISTMGKKIGFIFLKEELIISPRLFRCS
ncbi:MAG: hypothetical protein WAV16_01890 [Candidatus Moraniibacteriota bacterium]